jgi:predicted kinase
MRVTVLRGISGAGKTTWVKANAQDAVVVSADHFFEVDGKYIFDPTKLGEAHRACFRQFMDAVLAQKPHIVVDNTNISAWEFAPYVIAGEAYGYEVEIRTLVCTVDVSLQRKELVPPGDVKRMDERLQKETREMPPRFKAIHKVVQTC